jgi:hypothetical protein
MIEPANTEPQYDRILHRTGERAGWAASGDPRGVNKTALTSPRTIIVVHDPDSDEH